MLLKAGRAQLHVWETTLSSVGVNFTTDTDGDLTSDDESQKVFVVDSN